MNIPLKKVAFEKLIRLLCESEHRNQDIWEEFLNSLTQEKVEFTEQITSNRFKFLAEGQVIIACREESSDEECLHLIIGERADRNVKDGDLIVLAVTPKPFTSISLFFDQSKDADSKITIIRITPTQFPDYFWGEIEGLSSEKLKDLFDKWTDQDTLEKEFLEAVMTSGNNLEDSMFLVTVLLIWGVITKDERIDALSLYKSMTKNQFQEITVNALQRSSNLNALLLERLQVKELFKELDVSDNIFDIQLMSKLLHSFPYSWTEPSTYIQELAINPYTLSRVIEIYGRQQKKRGMYYTKGDDAEFSSFLGLYRYLQVNQHTNHLKRLRDAYNHPRGAYNGVLEVPTLPPQEISFRIMDPSCGTGTFLVSVVRLLIRSTQTDPQKSSWNLDLWGVDIAYLPLWITKVRLIFLQLVSCHQTGRQSLLPLNIKSMNLIKSDFFACSFSTSFDLILGNPPWVRHEDINYGTRTGALSKDQIHELIGRELGEEIVLARSDLFIFFCLRSLALLHPEKGQLSFILSISWLEVQFGQSLQHFLLDPRNDISLFEVLHWENERLWKDLGVNSVFFLASRALRRNQNLTPGFFTLASGPFSRIPPITLQRGILDLQENFSPSYRIEKLEGSILKETNKWAGNFLRTSRSVRRIVKKFQTRGKPLGKIAEVRFGIKTGANDFFYLTSVDKTPPSPDLIYIRNRLGYEGLIERKYCVPILKSPTEIPGFFIPSSFISKRWLFYCLDSVDQLEGKHARHLIEWGESVPLKIKQGSNSGNQIRGVRSLRSVMGRKQWYSIPETPIPGLVWAKSYHDRPGCFLNEKGILPDQRFYSIISHQKSLSPLIFLYLNSSLVWAQIEMQGNTNMGFGVLDTNVYILKNLYIPVEIGSDRQIVRSLVTRLKSQPNRYSILKKSPLRQDIDTLFFDHFDMLMKDRQSLSNFVTKTLRRRIGIRSNRNE